MPTLFIDNGGDTLRAIYSRSAPPIKRTSLSSGRKDSKDKDAGNEKPHFAPCRDLATVTAPNALGITSDGGSVGSGGPSHVFGPALLSLPHYHQLVLRRPTEKGFIVDAQLQALLWSQCLFEPLGIVSEREIDLFLTCPIACPHDAAQAIEQLLFETFRFRSVTVVTTAMLSMIGAEIHHSHKQRRRVGVESEVALGKKRPREDEANGASASSRSPFLGRPPLTGITVDCGFSGTTITPFLGGRPVPWNTIRIDVGGKVLTNHLKELISFSQVNVTEDTWLCNAVKERCCFIHGGPSAGVHASGEDLLLCSPLDCCEERQKEASRGSRASKSWSPVAAHCASTNSVADALVLYQKWSGMTQMEKRRVIANQRRLVKAMLKQVKQQEKEREKEARKNAKRGGRDGVEESSSAAALQTQIFSSEKEREEAALALAAGASRFWFPPPMLSYVLPSTPQTQPLGYVVDPEAAGENDDWQFVRLGHECFIVGEALLHPQLIGLRQVGIGEALRTGLWYDPRRAGTPLFGAPPSLQQRLLGNVILYGGTGVGLRGLARRLSSEVRPSLDIASTPAHSSDCTHRNEPVSTCSNTFVLPPYNDICSSQLSKAASRTKKDLEPASFLMSGALALCFGWYAVEVWEALAAVGLGAAATPVDALLDSEATIMSTKLTRDSVRAALGLVR